MLQSFCQYITDKGLFRPSQKILLAVSGGMDSIAMCHLFHHAGFSFAMAHCNFHLRGVESEEDEAFVKKLAATYHVPFFLRHFEAARYAEEKKISIQMAARELRYAWFHEVLQQEKYELLATAHHQNDVLETILLNLTRGTGIQGLHGIRPSNGKIIRPLLFASREEIQHYVKEKKLSWREDSSNESTKYYRNLIRHEVIPVLKKINPNLEQTLEQSIGKIQAVEALFFLKVAEVKKAAMKETNECISIDIATLTAQAEPGILLYELIKPFNFNYKDGLTLLSTGDTGKRIESVSHIAVRDRKTFIITPKFSNASEVQQIEQDQKQLILDGERLSFSVEENTHFKIPASPAIACLDVDKLKFPLILRKWQEGDSFCPLGMSQKKKISDLLIDLKVPLNLKDKVKVLISGENIAWVVGFRIDERYKVGIDTEKIFRIMKENL